jgi:hypothetical protein
MKFRPRHLACLILLLSTLSGAERSLLRASDFRLNGHYISVLLSGDHGAPRSEPTPEPRALDLSDLALPAALAAQHRPAFAPRPPSAHSMQLQAVTSFGA